MIVSDRNSPEAELFGKSALFSLRHVPEKGGGGRRGVARWAEGKIGKFGNSVIYIRDRSTIFLKTWPAGQKEKRKIWRVV